MRSAPVQARDRVEILDLLRLIAVLAVVLFHYGFRGAAADGYTQTSLADFAWIAKYGYLGVQLFFVISGFVIAYSAAGRTATAFVIARAARIYPAFVVCMTVTFVATVAIGAPRFHASIAQWLANLIVVAPALKQPFMDGAYWSIVYEITFYAWVAIMIFAGVFRRRLDVIVVSWLALSILNEAWLGSEALRRVLITDQSAFFASGLLLYELYAGRRDAVVMVLLAVAVVVALDQGLGAAHWIGGRSGIAFDRRVVVAASLGSVGIVALALWVRHINIRPEVVAAIGGLTYPLYLLHQHIGYMVFNRLHATAPAEVLVGVTIVAMMAMSWTIWRFVERPGQRLVKHHLSAATDHVQEKWIPLLRGTRDQLRASLRARTVPAP